MKLVREHIINEKFRENSDPVYDLGIGLYIIRNFKSDEEAVDFIISIMPSLLKMNKIPNDILHYYTILGINKKYSNIIRDYREKYIRVNGHESENFYQILPRKLHKMGFKYNLLEQCNINEKFTEDVTDPIRDMNIGGFSFDTLRSGAIITAIVPRLSLKRNNDGYFTYPGKGIDLPVDYPLLVIEARNYIIPGHKEIKIIKISSDIKEVMKVRQEFQNNPSVRWGAQTRMIIKEKKFNRMFKVIERGF